MRAVVRILVCCMLVLGSSPAWAVTLQQPASSIIRVTHNPCWVHPSNVCSVALYPEPARLMPAGGSGWFQAVMGSQYPGYTLSNGGSLNGTLRIQQYDAYNDDNPGGCEFHMFLDKAAGDPADVEVAQGICTNHRLNGPAGTAAHYMDVLVDSDPGTAEPPLYPYQEPRPGYADGEFYDKPARPCPDNGYIYWVAEMYVTDTDTAAQTMAVYDGVEYGFIYTCWGLTPMAADDGTGTTGATTGTRDSIIQYTPTGMPFEGQLSLAGPINIMNTTGGDELDPMFAGDPLGNCWMEIWGLELHGEVDDSGGYQFLHIGEEGDFNMIVYGPGGEVALQAQVVSLYCNDQMFDQTGQFNMVAVYGNIEPLNMIGSMFVDMYDFQLHYEQGDEFVNAPKFTVGTMGPFSSLLADGTIPVESLGTVKNGFALERGGSIYNVKGDMNCDGLLNGFDIDSFIVMLDSPETYHTNNPDCPGEQQGDMNGDGYVNGFDIDGFVAALGG
ncbi:MAG: hypothetical protein KKB50_08265 [Planctomycetes bacterium]|nr:hypothetical protein [Planctomycetota bacterium]